MKTIRSDGGADASRRRAALQERYDWVHIANDLLLGVWFFTGSILFFYEHLELTGRWFFLLGTSQMLVRPVLRIAHKLHIGRMAWWLEALE